MPIINLTGSADLRMNEIEKNWFITEPGSDLRTYQYPLYTVPIGQTCAAEMLVNTGSLMFTSGTLQIEKDIHIFEDESDAESFLGEVGVENVASISETYGVRPDLSIYRIIQVQLINYPKAKIDVELLNCPLERGFKIEVFTSSSLGLSEIEREPKFNARGDLVSETFLKYFEIEEDV